MEQCVIKDWVLCLPLKQQTVLLTVLRGCDGRNKNDPSKLLIRAIRSVILKNADESSTFMELSIFDEMADKFLEDLDSYNIHWILHFTHACEIIGYSHPVLEVRKDFLNLYYSTCSCFHMNPETKQEMEHRLSDKTLKAEDEKNKQTD